MNPESIKNLLQEVQKKKITVESALDRLRILPFKDLGFAKVDTHRGLRRGFPEVIYCEGKTKLEVKKIFAELASSGENVIATRADAAVYSAVRRRFKKARFHKPARIITLIQRPVKKKGLVLIVTGGTSDNRVAEEARITLGLLGADTKELYDVGVAGLHRLLAYKEWLDKATVIVVVAGMEGALPSVVAGFVDKPVIAVPTSTGYGASFGGIAALFGMLNSCSPGVTVVNIDNGFGAGYAAGVINRVK